MRKKHPFTRPMRLQQRLLDNTEEATTGHHLPQSEQHDLHKARPANRMHAQNETSTEKGVFSQHNNPQQRKAIETKEAGHRSKQIGLADSVESRSKAQEQTNCLPKKNTTAHPHSANQQQTRKTHRKRTAQSPPSPTPHPHPLHASPIQAHITTRGGHPIPARAPIATRRSASPPELARDSHFLPRSLRKQKQKRHTRSALPSRKGPTNLGSRRHTCTLPQARAPTSAQI
jgi:hypothetical protein